MNTGGMADDRMCLHTKRSSEEKSRALIIVSSAKDFQCHQTSLQHQVVCPNYVPVASSVPLVSSEYDDFSQFFSDSLLQQ